MFLTEYLHLFWIPKNFHDFLKKLLLLFSCSVIHNFLRQHRLQHTSFPVLTVSGSLLKVMSIESVTPPNHLILCHPLLLLPSIFPSIRVFPNELALRIRWPKYWSFSFSISPSNEYSKLNSFRIDWLDLLVIQRTLKSLLQHHSLKAWVLLHSAFFIVQLSHLYMTTGETIALTMWTFVCKIMSLLLNTLSRFVIAFLPRSTPLLISWLQSPSAVILEPKKIKSVTVFIVPKETFSEISLDTFHSQFRVCEGGRLEHVNWCYNCVIGLLFLGIILCMYTCMK